MTAPGSIRRVILHVDMDAFFVSVELRRRPELVGRPVVVGGTGPRGVIAAASYEARRYGVRSALPSVTARRLCPHAVFLPGDHALYGEVSAQVNEIFRSITPLVEPLSLDEAFLDVSGAVRLLGPGRVIAQEVRRRVFAESQLHCSVGVAPNKFLAKLASVAAKPTASPAGVVEGAGVVEVEPGRELEFLHPLPVKAIWGVGPATLERLTRLGIGTVGELALMDEASLVASLGSSHGRHLHRLAWGIDDRPVVNDQAIKSIGHEETYPTDKHTYEELRAEVVRLADGVASRLRAHGTGARTLTLKVRFAGFTTITRSTTLPGAVTTAHAIVEAVDLLLRAVDPSAGVRLLGVSASNFSEPAEQLTLDRLFEEPEREVVANADPAGDGSRIRRKPGRLDPDWRAAESTVDAIRSRFGGAAIGPASAVDPRGLRVVRRGAQQWGPDQPEPER